MIIIRRVDGADPSDTSHVELICIPLLVISNVEFEIHDALNGLEESTDLTHQACICE